MTTSTDTTPKIKKFIQRCDDTIVIWDLGMKEIVPEDEFNDAEYAEIESEYTLPRIAITCEIGFGVAHTFLNALRIMLIKGNDIDVLDSRFYQMCQYKDDFIDKESREIIFSFLRNDLAHIGVKASEQDLSTLTDMLLEKAVRFY